MSTDLIDAASLNILGSKRVLSRNPAARSLVELYPGPGNASTQLAETSNSKGRVRISSNSLSLGSQSNFSISSSSILANCNIHATLKLPENRYVQSGWLFQAVDRFEITFSNSLMQNVSVSGKAYREYCLVSAPDRDCRELLIDQAGHTNNGTADEIVTASIPLTYLIGSIAGAKGGWPVDTSTLNGPIQVNVIWHSAGAFSAPGLAAGAAIPIAFESLIMTLDSSDLITQAMSVRTSLMFDPELSYNIPVKYLSREARTLNFDPTAGGEQVINLTGAPSGMLEAIIFSIKPTSDLGSAALSTAAKALYNPLGGSVNLKAIKLEYSGVTLFQAETPEELRGNYRNAFCGDTLAYRTSDRNWTDAAGIDSAHVISHELIPIVIPMGYDMRNIMSGHLVENLPSYSGASLSLKFRVDNVLQRTIYAHNEPFLRVNEPSVAPGASDFTVEVLYVISAIMEINSQNVDLIL